MMKHPVINLEGPVDRPLSLAQKLGAAAAFLVFGFTIMLALGIATVIGLGLLVSISFLLDLLAGV